MGLKYDQDWAEIVELADGRVIHLRIVRPSDRELLRRGFDAMSPESRYLRFFTNKKRLTDAELDYLTVLDGQNHFALGATTIDSIGRETGVAVARFIRLPNESGVAEPAIAVSDDFQGLGLGTLMTDRLAQAALERGVRMLQFEVLSSNERMKHVIDDVALFADVDAAHVDGVLRIRVKLRGAQPEGPLFSELAKRMMRHAATEVASLALKYSV